MREIIEHVRNAMNEGEEITEDDVVKVESTVRLTTKILKAEIELIIPRSRYSGFRVITPDDMDTVIPRIGYTVGKALSVINEYGMILDQVTQYRKVWLYGMNHDTRTREMVA